VTTKAVSSGDEVGVEIGVGVRRGTAKVLEGAPDDPQQEQIEHGEEGKLQEDLDWTGHRNLSRR
jgi:hypothetical protein